MNVFLKMREFKTHHAFCTGISITCFHSFPMWADHQDGVCIFFNSVNTRIQFVLNLLLNSVFILE